MQHNWLDKNEYPFRSKYFNVNNFRLHYIDEGEGDVILFVHGTPSWSFDYRTAIKKLSTRHRCVAIDHIGFGLSDKPEHYDYATVNHSSTLEKFILAQHLQNITLVVHDFGGPIGLNFALQHPERVTRLVVLNSWMWSSTNDPDFIKFSKILKNPLLPFLYRHLNFSPRFVMPQSFGDHKLTRKTRVQYTRPFADATQRNGALAFAHSLLNDQDWFEQLWAQRHKIAGKPTLFIWGMKDPVIKPHYLKKFLTGFPVASICELATSGHFPQEEEPELVAEQIDAFMKGSS